MISFVDPSTIGAIGSGTVAQRSRALATRFKGANKGKYFLMPYNDVNHWTLTVVKPEAEMVYYMDPLKCRIAEGEWVDVVDNSIKLYKEDLKKVSKNKVLWENMAHDTWYADVATFSKSELRFQLADTLGTSHWGIYITGSSLIGAGIKARGMDFGNNLEEMFKGFMIRLYHLKCVHGISESAFGELLKLIKEVFPEAHLPLSFNAAKNAIKDLVGRKKDGKLRHPADGEAWKMMDAQYPNFSSEHRNMNLELKELWDVGIETYDGLTDQNFKLRARVIWTSSDFLGYAMLFSWSTKGKLGETKDTMSHSARNASLEYHIGTKKYQDGKVFKLKHADWKASHQYVLFNYGNNEIESLIREHRVSLDGEATSKRFKRERTHTSDFWIWLKEQVLSKDSISRDLEVLALGPNRAARRMDDTIVNVRLHYEELVKYNLHFIEIGGIYANRGRKGGWQLLSNNKQVMALVEDCGPCFLVNFYIENIVDKQIEPAPQMQPHVITRPRENFIQASPEKPLKHKFVTTHQLQQQKKKMDKKLPEVGGWQDILTKESGQDIPVSENEKVTARRKLSIEPCAGDVEDTGNNDVVEKLPPPSPLLMFLKRNMEKVKKARCRGDADKMLPRPPPLCEYEKLKLDKMMANNEVYKSLGLPQILSTFKDAVKSSSKSKGKKGKETAIEEDDSQ
ncbi:hypothetical protein AgCh_034657 [Apium graveolens]